MKAEDLRKGNVVLYNGEIVNGINTIEIYHFDIGKIKLEPIPLTEEWFDMFEFEKTEPVNAKLHPYPDYLKDGVIISLPYFEFTYNDGDNSRVLKYVHELMNLYYILTGEELEVKL